MIIHASAKSLMRAARATALIAAVLLGAEARAKNVDLSTVPSRDGVQ